MQKEIVNALGIGAAALAMATGAASTARADEEVVAKVPFAFIVGSTELPAGTYTIQGVVDDPGVVAITSRDGRHNAFTIVTPTVTQAPPQKAELVFSKVGDRYVLKEIVQSDGDEEEVMITK